jgi:hypothetical protein
MIMSAFHLEQANSPLPDHQGATTSINEPLALGRIHPGMESAPPDNDTYFEKLRHVTRAKKRLLALRPEGDPAEAGQDHNAEAEIVGLVAVPLQLNPRLKSL